MTQVSRGGLTLKTGKIGRCNILRQQLLMPGERMNVRINGSVRLESLRERDVMRINAHLATFMTPVRWLQSDWPDYVKEGSDTTVTIPTVSETDFSKYGVGSGRQDSATTINMKKWFKDAPLRIYNEWYKFPEDSDATDWDDDGNKAVPLSKAWSRCRYSYTPDDSDDYTLNSASNFSVQNLAAKQAEFRAAMKRDVTSYNRWLELVQQTWAGSDPSREIDQVPIMLDQTEVGVQPRDMPATDGSSLGTYQSIYDFNVDHSIRGIVAPEHCVITYILTVRFPSITEGIMPICSPYTTAWWDNVADPEMIGNEHPQSVRSDDLFGDTAATVMGYLPAGWKWRCDHDVIGSRIYKRKSFPYMQVPTTQAEAKDATRIQAAFRSQSLGDYMADIYFDEKSYQPVGTAADSYFSGMIDDTRNMSNSNDEFPFGGKQL
jgi:hypothetical protein